MNSQDSSRTHTTTSEFTAHAAVLLKQYYRGDSSFGHNDEATSTLSEQCEQLNTKAYELLKCEIHKTFPQCDVLKIHRINAPQMYGMYLLRKAEMRLQENGGNDIEEVLYHVTAESNAVESLISGLDWRRTQRPRFGSGVSFSNDVDYGNYHANQSTNIEGTRVIIVSTVPMNDTHVVTEKWIPTDSLIIPPGTADTTASPNGHVFVKYNDFEFYPMFFVYYRWSPELRNESKFSVTNNDNLQKLQQQQEELQTLCQQVTDLCIGAESISQQCSNSSKQQRKRQRRAAVKADLAAIAATAAPTKAETTAAYKAVAVAKAKSVAAAEVAAAAEAEATAKAKAEATAEAKAVAAAKLAAAAKAKAVAAAEAAATAKARAVASAKDAAAAEAKYVAAGKAIAAIKICKRRRRRAAAAEVDATAGSVMTPRRQ